LITLNEILSFDRTILYGTYAFQICEHYMLGINARVNFPCLEKPCLF